MTHTSVARISLTRDAFCENWKSRRAARRDINKVDGEKIAERQQDESTQCRQKKLRMNEWK